MTILKKSPFSSQTAAAKDLCKMCSIKSRTSTTAVPCANPGGCISNVQHADLFKLIRWLMWFTVVRSIPLENYLPKRWSGYSTALNLTLEISMFLSLVHICVLYICTFYINYGNGDMELLVSSALQILIYSWAIIIKIFFRRIRPELVVEIMDYVNAEHVTHSAVGFTYVTMQECLEQSNKIIKAFVGGCVLGTSFWMVVPIAYEERTLPLPCWYPIDYKEPFIYPLAYFLQNVAQLQLGCTFAVSSLYFLALCLLLSGQFDVLDCSLKNILATTYIYMGASMDELIELREQQRIADEEVNQYFIAKEMALNLDCIPHLLNPTHTPRLGNFRDAFHCALAPCVKQHRFILNALRKTECLYSILWMFKTLVVTFSICAMAFDVVKSTNDKSLLQVLSFGQYMFLVVWEIFMICYGGEIVYVNSQRCGEALLRSPWYLHSREVRADFLLFLLHAQRAFELTGGKFYPLRLEKFRTIVTTSFSFFTLLQNMDTGN